jgi:hypothetical protein
MPLAFAPSGDWYALWRYVSMSHIEVRASRVIALSSNSLDRIAITEAGNISAPIVIHAPDLGRVRDVAEMIARQLHPGVVLGDAENDGPLSIFWRWELPSDAEV